MTPIMNESDIGAAIQMAVINFLAGSVHTAMPGRVESYNATKRTADVKPMLKRAGIDGTQTEYAVLPDVPVAIYGTAGAAIELPIVTGDFVLLIFSERATDGFVESGSVSNTTVNRLYNLSDAVALPGIFPRSWSRSDAGAGDVNIYNNGGKVTINASGDIELGNGTLSALCTSAFLNHTHAAGTLACATAPGPVAGVTGGPVAAIPPISYVTTKVKAQ